MAAPTRYLLPLRARCGCGRMATRLVGDRIGCAICLPAPRGFSLLWLWRCRCAALNTSEDETCAACNAGGRPNMEETPA
jgi:hypothetical protein